MIQLKIFQKNVNHLKLLKTFSTTVGKSAPKKGIAVGVYENGELTSAASRVNIESQGKVMEILKGSDLRLGITNLAHNLIPGYDVVSLVGAGAKNAGMDQAENLDRLNENIRIAAGRAAKSLMDEDVALIEVDPFTNAEAAAEGAILAVWNFDYLKSDENKKVEPTVLCSEKNEEDVWERGRIKAEAQNFARVLTQCPSNLMTPTHFVECVIDKLCPCGVQVEARDRKWMQEQNMEAFLSMATGSTEAPLMLAPDYCGGNPDSKPVILTGKGVTFDGHGVCHDRQCDPEFSADMAGAAVVVATIKALCELKVPINVNAIIPLCENMPGGNAVAPGAVFTALNGITIRIDDTDHDGRIFLVDALCYAARYKPCLTINVSTLHDSMRIALGTGATGVYTLGDGIWKDMSEAGAKSGDRVWRLPLWDHYRVKVQSDHGADLTTVGKGLGGHPCSAAAFLKLFAPPSEFAHMDISGTGRKSSGINHPYLHKNLMTGRPVRTLVDFFCKYATRKD
ncbi:hypothetical protein LSTR_LSTR010752 [Laodelphax striatellus]|uniref:Cytosol aminopeptidase n=1 Tax=Laodelphax striatellus TaxID=195883 RepID=A0A482XRP0_LAOST|nr:hypothetical protein LSTR_LSTR010752 [Laodelphax striatellus]